MEMVMVMVLQLLVAKKEDRMTLAEALEHPFLRKFEPSSISDVQ